MKIKKIKNDKLVFGVLAGFAYSLQMQTWIVRVAFIILAFITAFVPAAIIYFIIVFMMPEWEEDPSDYNDVCK